MERQRQALLNMLIVLRESLRDLDDIAPTWRTSALARRVRGAARALSVVGEVLIGAMAEVAGDAWKPEYTAAWQEAYAVVKDVMLRGADTGR